MSAHRQTSASIICWISAVCSLAFIVHAEAKVTYIEKEIASLLHGMKSARSLAHRCRLTAEKYPKYAREDMAECQRHFARARDYLQLVRAKRASQ